MMGNIKKGRAKKFDEASAKAMKSKLQLVSDGTLSGTKLKYKGKDIDNARITELNIFRGNTGNDELKVNVTLDIPITDMSIDLSNLEILLRDIDSCTEMAVISEEFAKRREFNQRRAVIQEELRDLQNQLNEVSREEQDRSREELDVNYPQVDYPSSPVSSPRIPVVGLAREVRARRLRYDGGREPNAS